MDRLLDKIGRTCFWLFALPGLYTGVVAVRELTSGAGASTSLSVAAPFFFNVGFLFASLGLIKTKRMWFPAGLAVIAAALIVPLAVLEFYAHRHATELFWSLCSVMLGLLAVAKQFKKK
jgi:hypothetical protein